MANSPQAIKRARQIKKVSLQNASMRSAMRTHIKKFLQTLVDSPEKANLPALMSLIDRMRTHGILHRNKAARLKSRLHQKLKKATQA